MGNFPPEPDRRSAFVVAALVIAVAAFTFGAAVGYALGLVRG